MSKNFKMGGYETIEQVNEAINDLKTNPKYEDVEDRQMKMFMNTLKEEKARLKNKPALKDGKKTDFGMLSVKKGIDKNPKPTQADRIAGATMKDGSSRKVRGVRIANKGYGRAKLS